LPTVRAVISASLLALSLVACAGAPTGKEVIEQAQPGGKVAFDVVDLSDSVLTTVLAHQQPPFHERFKEYVPAAELKIDVGDTVSVVIWESGSEGLFGESLTEMEFPAGAAALAEIQPPAGVTGVPLLPSGLAAPPNLLAMLFGGGVPNLAAAAAAAAAGGAAESATPPQLEQLLDLATQSGRPGTRIPDQQVGTDGAISIPYGGRIKVAGRTPQQVEHLIVGRLAAKALDPQALVTVSQSAANTVSVAGGAIDGKRVPLPAGGDRLLQVIAAAGGAKAPVHDTFVQLSRGGVTASVPLATLVADPVQDIFAEPGDVLTLVKREQTYSVFGATGKNTAITFDSDRLSLAEALAKAGGLNDDRADPRAVFLFRYEPVELVRALGEPVASSAHDGLSPVVYRIDLKRGRSYLLARQFPVHDKDVIFAADAFSQRIYYSFQALQQVTGPIISGIVTCQSTKC
jgi:polysaccharide export outer membrane protein